MQYTLSALYMSRIDHDQKSYSTNLETGVKEWVVEVAETILASHCASPVVSRQVFPSARTCRGEATGIGPLDVH
jgi:hypothetical protein